MMEDPLESVTRPQLVVLWEFLRVNERVAAGDTLQDMLQHRCLWETAAVVLNAIEDDFCRDWNSWAQLWIHLKFQIRQKLYNQLQREGHEDRVTFSDVETKFSQFVENIETPLEHIRQKMENDVEIINNNDSKINHDSDDESVKSESSSDDDKPLSKKARRRRVIQPQLDALFEALSCKKWVGAGFNKSSESRQHNRKFWEKTARTLNAIPQGDCRDWRSWAKYWVDYKGKTNNKIRRYKNGDPSIELSSNDLTFMKIMNKAPKPIKIISQRVTTADVQNKDIVSEVDDDKQNSINSPDEESAVTEAGDDSDLDNDVLDLDTLNRQFRRRVNAEQLSALYQCLQHNTKVAMGRTKCTESRYGARIVWKKAATVLNAVPGGAFKDWKGWNKYWIDLKAKTKRRVSQARAGHHRQPLTTLEIKFMQLVNVDVSGLSGMATTPTVNSNDYEILSNPEDNESNSGMQLTVNCSDTNNSEIHSDANNSGMQSDANNSEMQHNENISDANNSGMQHNENISDANNSEMQRNVNCSDANNSDASVDDMKRTRRVSLHQLNALWECLNADREVAFGSNRTSELRMKSMKMWKKTAQTLNAIKDGDTKTWKAWSKYWVDMKGKINHRVRRINVGETDVQLTSSDRRFLQLMQNAESDKAGNNSDCKNVNIPKSDQRCSSDEEAVKHSDTCYDNDSDVDDRVQGSRRVSVAQQNALWQCLKDNKAVAFGFNKTVESRHRMLRMWAKTASILNRINDGDVKTAKAWSKYWVDVKAKLNSRLRRIRAGDRDVQLTNTDLKFLQLIQANSRAGRGEPRHQYDSTLNFLAPASVDSQHHPKKKKKKSDQRNLKENVKESIDSEASSNSRAPSPDLEENTEIVDFKQEHIELDVRNLNQDENLQHKTRNKDCTECCLDQDSVVRNQTFSNLLINELKYLPACMRSQAYINILKYLETLKSKHNTKINNLTQKDDYFELVHDMNTDPLNG